MKAKKRYSAEERIKILREHLEGGSSISDLSEKYEVHPNAIYKWKKELFEKGAGIVKPDKIQVRREITLQNRIQELEQTLHIRESLIADIVSDNISLKKKMNGEN